MHYQSFLYILKIIWIKLINRYHNILLGGHFSVEKTYKLVARKYYWLTLCHIVKDDVKRCNICLALKTVQYKPYGDLQSLLVSTHRWNNLSVDFVTKFSISIDWKENNYDLILVIVNWLIKIIYYDLVKVSINALGLAKVIIDVVVRYHSLPDTIVTKRGLLFTSKF